MVKKPCQTACLPSEHMVVTMLGKACNLSNCLDLYFFVGTFCDLDAHTGIFKKVKASYILHFTTVQC
jgi:hypothetical protein